MQNILLGCVLGSFASYAMNKIINDRARVYIGINTDENYGGFIEPRKRFFAVLSGIGIGFIVVKYL